ncbi:hypothetical protein [Microbacterium jiangjiandongii]|uniref:hypothetical protein n=1 Tax=Microbacterium jiangjiandongii TaxID=3049071 RepID=UPI00214B374E|nr:hypothetical protein [Microbacterium sp. zg.Y843]MCR2814619.1 hypothetical protein [Microbacterium sp. zg.Y843]
MKRRPSSTTALWAIAAVLTVGGAGGIFLTRAAWTPCVADGTSVPCLEAMDGPLHLSALQLFWMLAFALTLWAVGLVGAHTGRVVAWTAVAVVAIMNQFTEYLLWLGIAGGHWDVPPGTGYTQALSFVVAGLLVAVAAGLRRRRPARCAGAKKPRSLASA